jgi:hypothetical protein
MKKALLVCMLLAGLTSCKDPKTETTKTVDATTADSTATNTTEANATAAAVSCALPIVIDLGRITNEAEREAWLSDPENNHLCTPKTLPTAASPSVCSVDGKVYFDLGEIKVEFNDPETFKLQAAWLHKNGHLICFPETYCYLSGSHEIKMQSTITDIEKEPLAHRDEFKLSEIIAKITSRGGKYLTDDYDDYLVVAYSGGQILLTLENQYKSPYFNFSIPFLRSIVECNKIQGDPMFEFIYYEKANPDVVVIKVTSGTKTWYFDYSQQPQKK